MGSEKDDPYHYGRDPSGLGGRFWSLWTASTVSNLADGVLKVALPLVAAGASTSPALVAGVAVAVTGPWLVLALPAGVLVDRVDRRRAMVLANAVRAAGAALVVAAAVLDGAGLVVLYAAAVLIGAAEVVHDTAAQALLPQVVPRARLPRANGRLQAAELTANEFVGPPLGGLLVGLGAALAFTVPALTWMVAAGVLLLLPGSFRVLRSPGTAQPTLLADVREGLGHLWRAPVLRRLALTTGAYNLASNATFAVLVLHAVGRRSALGLTGTEYGLLLATIAAGVLVGALLADRVERHLGSSRTVLLGYLLALSLFAVLTASTHVVVIAAGFAVGGAGLGLWNVVVVSMRQRVTPDALLGRVSSAYRLVAWGTRPLGAALGGGVGQVLGLRAVFLLAGAIALFGMLGVVRTASDERGT